MNMSDRSYTKLLQILMVTAPFFIGSYHEWASCIITVYLILILLLHEKKKRGMIAMAITPGLIATAAVAALYGLSILWAVDRGMAPLGFVKFLPLPLFALAIGQLDGEQRNILWQPLPLSGVIMVLVSLGLSRISALSEFFMVNGRLSGFFQYPNTFALYLLVCVVLILFQNELNIRRMIYLAVLFLGVALSGSRTGFILWGAVLIIFLVRSKSRKGRLYVAALAGLLLAASGIYAAVTGDFSSAARYLTTSASSSTLLGRLLYCRDALPIILKHPFGLGYMGYFFTQGSFQTGVYSVVNIHNELFQLLLDIGWVPTIICIWVLIRSFRSGGITERVIIVVIVLHSMLDFDLQFIAIDLILLAALSYEPLRSVRWKGRTFGRCCAAVLGVCALYFGAASGLYYMRAHSATVELYPGYTNAWIELLQQAENSEQMDEIANHILTLDSVVPLANSAKARTAFAAGDFEGVILFKEKAISYARYSLDEYLDYFDMLYVGIVLYEQVGDLYSAAVCRERILAIPEMLAEVKNSTSALGWRIQDQPELDLPETYMAQLMSLG